MKCALTISIFALLAIMALSGCGRTPRLVLVGVDVSGSAAEGKTRYADYYKLIVKQDNGESNMALYTFAQQPHYVTTGNSSNLMSAYQLSEDEITNALTSEKRGTFFLNILNEFYAIAIKDPKTPVIGILLTDGGIDDRDNEALMLAGQALADLPNFNGLFIGPVTGEVINVRSAFRPLWDANKLVITGTKSDDIGRGIKEILQKNEVK